MTRADPRPHWIVLGRDGDDTLWAALDSAGVTFSRERVRFADVGRRVREAELRGGVRWVWHDTPAWYPPLLHAGIRVERAHDLRLCHAILRDSAFVPPGHAVGASRAWDAEGADGTDAAPALFDLPTARGSLPSDLDEALAEFARQRDAIAAAKDSGRLRLLTAAESAGALVASELRAAGLPWDAAAHDRILSDMLGERPTHGGLPSAILAKAAEVRAALGDPTASLDSQPKLLRALHRVGVNVDSTSRWELRRHEHPVVAPLIEYKRMMRLLTANGWNWLSEWVHDDRFRPVYVPAGVVTGRWASSGGGALQIPRQLRAAVRADRGWKLVVADVAQLEPRVLAAMSRDTALADAARGADLYGAIAERGKLEGREKAKLALLGAMYGATSGESGRLVPQLRKTYPRAMKLVDDAARVGEDGGVVSTWLGRTSPPPSRSWQDVQSDASDSEASELDTNLARRVARDRGRFTRNFVVQGTAAEWALAWMAELRNRLSALPEVPEDRSATASGPVFARRAHLAFYLHDEVVVHAPAEHAEAAAQAISDSAVSAGRLLFGDFPVDFRLDVHISDSAEKV
ncbi:bifunctional 3'-5' exonuclease/DNA polymerase [Microbacterium sp. P07]|uniref:bifunctional 3'-5' exonuclease/DNA polymerase n=1 Tax=Microbacterium sp. P07 TaxID=3366952 RepID=UPI003745A341